MKLPLHHLSVRVPWHDNKWNGCVCKDPKNNSSCMFLPRMLTKDVKIEETCTGKQLEYLNNSNYYPPCIGEKVSFMSEEDIMIKVEHTYRFSNKRYSHFKETPLTHKSYSFSVIPFQWMLKDRKTKDSLKAKEYCLDYSPEKEPDLGFEDTWVQSNENQQVMLDSFISAIEPNKSLVFVYAKNIPLIEHVDRVLIGVGRITGFGNINEYSYSENNPDITAYKWERSVYHSIRPNYKDGFLLPYHEIMDLVNKEEITNPEEYIAYASNWEQFSYGSELVDHDSAIDALLALRSVLLKCENVLDIKYTSQLKWIDDRMSELWDMRGPYPGLGPVLIAFGVENANLIAWEIQKHLKEIDGETPKTDPWEIVDIIFYNKATFLDERIIRSIGETLRQTWFSLSEDKKAYLKLISRITLTNDQAIYLYDINDINIFLENPYRFYEIFRDKENLIKFQTIDKSLFPVESIRNKFPIPSPSNINESVDKRRIRALVIEILENAALEGHTLLNESTIITRIREKGIEPECPVTRDILNAVESFFQEDQNCLKVLISSDSKEKYYKLERLEETSRLIYNFVEKRVFQAKRFEVIEKELKKILNEKFPLPESNSINYKKESIGQKEKLESLKELFSSRFTVLIGPAGTGKTELLKIFCQHSDIKQNGILRLAPTGKARVQLGADAKTIAQFLLNNKRYDRSLPGILSRI